MDKQPLTPPQAARLFAINNVCRRWLEQWPEEISPAGMVIREILLICSHTSDLEEAESAIASLLEYLDRTSGNKGDELRAALNLYTEVYQESVPAATSAKGWRELCETLADVIERQGAAIEGLLLATKMRLSPETRGKWYCPICKAESKSLTDLENAIGHKEGCAYVVAFKALGLSGLHPPKR